VSGARAASPRARTCSGRRGHRARTCSILVPPERLLHHVSAADGLRREEILAGLERIYGPEAADPVALITRDWGLDPFTQGP
jgi:hypothetical protein